MKNHEQLINENKAWAEGVFKKIDNKMRSVTLRSRDKVGVDGVDADGIHKKSRLSFWTSGFWGALNYLLYEHTKDEEYLKTAKASERGMDEAFLDFESLHHDVGFMWHILSGVGYRLTGDEASRVRNLFAASTLSGRFILNGGYIRAWNANRSGEDGKDINEGRTIVDCMMNVPLLYWASREIGDDRFKQIAMAHADRTIEDHIRPDGSVVHIVDRDRESGEVVATRGGQGYAVGSSWSRGQAWGLYGFVLSYIHTGEVRYLDAAKRIANYFIASCCDDWLPRVDFRSPSEPVYYDSTAGAIAACGLIELGKILPEHEGGMYTNAAINILRAMEKSFCNFDPANDHMLDYGSVRYPATKSDMEKINSLVHISIIYGDYFYTEAILKLMGSEFLPW
ncbi:MAG: glycoside hydrolase family 88 protein [Clostridia bacterium]|nr:glycoside hydrolase family 88 protein [Clostridia bacterium]